MKKWFLTIPQCTIKDFQSYSLRIYIYIYTHTHTHILVYCLFEEETCMIFNNLEETTTLIHKIMWEIGVN
jgi:hypothetical protein